MLRNLAAALTSTVVALSVLGNGGSAYAADKIKVGFVATFTGPLAILGKNLRDGFELGVEHAGGKLGGLPTEMIFEDDQGKPDAGRQIVDKFLEFNKVDVVAGVIFSNVMMAIHGPIVRSKTVLIGANAGPSPIAGEQCSEYFFSTSWQGDNLAEAMGAHLTARGADNVYLMAPNYQAGKDVLAGFKRFFKGKIAAEVYTSLNQVDFSAELAQLRATNPSAVFVFYPGGLGVQFLQQYSQAGLKGKIPLYTAYMIDNTTLSAMGDAALDIPFTAFWNDDMDNAANKKFVADFKKKFNYTPSNYAAQGYDAARLLDAGVRGVGGKIEAKPEFLAALKLAKFESVRGKFRFNNNQFPIQDFYLAKATKDAEGKFGIQLGANIMRDQGDAYASKCPLK